VHRVRIVRILLEHLRMLEQNAYVRCLLIDFSKAFDSVYHIILLSKFAQLNLSIVLSLTEFAHFWLEEASSVKLMASCQSLNCYDRY